MIIDRRRVRSEAVAKINRERTPKSRTSKDTRLATVGPVLEAVIDSICEAVDDRLRHLGFRLRHGRRPLTREEEVEADQLDREIWEVDDRGALNEQPPQPVTLTAHESTTIAAHELVPGGVSPDECRMCGGCREMVTFDVAGNGKYPCPECRLDEYRVFAATPEGRVLGLGGR